MGPQGDYEQKILQGSTLHSVARTCSQNVVSQELRIQVFVLRMAQTHLEPANEHNNGLDPPQQPQKVQFPRHRLLAEVSFPEV